MTNLRIGNARDIHRLEENNRPFILGGVLIPFTKGPVSHSDGDCLYHAIAESILGALALGDLGAHFPDTDFKYKDMDSSIIVSKAMELIKERSYRVVNIDTSIILESPKLQKYLPMMKENIARLLEIDVDRVSIKAQTNESIGEVGLNKAVECYSTILIDKD